MLSYLLEASDWFATLHWDLLKSFRIISLEISSHVVYEHMRFLAFDLATYSYISSRAQGKHLSNRAQTLPMRAVGLGLAPSALSVSLPNVSCESSGRHPVIPGLLISTRVALYIVLVRKRSGAPRLKMAVICRLAMF